MSDKITRKPMGLGRSQQDMEKVLSAIPAARSLEPAATVADAELAGVATARQSLAAGRTAGEEEANKQRVTHYLSTEVLERLENAYDEIRRALDYKHKTRIKKSHIVEEALVLILAEWQRSGRDSGLGRLIERLKNEGS